jgi:hypothetical protein
LAATLGIGLPLGVAHAVVEVFERAGNGVFAAGDVRRGALTDILGSHPQPRGNLFLLELDQGFAHACRGSALALAQITDGLLQLALEGLHFLVHRELLFG